MTAWEEAPVSARIRRALDRLADAATMHQPGMPPSWPVGAIADLRKCQADVDAMEREMAEMRMRAGRLLDGREHNEAPR